MSEAASGAGPALSVVLAPVARGAFLAEALESFAAQAEAPLFEIIVPVDDSIDAVDAGRGRGGAEALAALGETYPAVRFVAVEGTAEQGRSADFGIAHLAIDRRRAAAIAAARAPLVAVTDEWARPRTDWCREIVRAHEAPHAVIGGAIGCARDRAINWALFFMDGGRYQNPLPEGPAVFVTDVNVSYKRAALELTDVWREEYHETRLHDELRHAGETLWLTPRLVVDVDRGEIALAEALRERFAWSRLYAGRRSQEVSGAMRAALAAGSPLLALVLLFRQVRLAWQRGAHRGALLRCLPILILMDLVWSVGEATGYLTGRGTASA